MAASGTSSMAVAMAAVVAVVLCAGVRPAEACNGHPCPSPAGNCPVNAVKLAVCADVLDGLIHVVVGQSPPKQPCCSLISDLVDLDAAACVCLAINANVLGINLDVDVDLTLLLNCCGCKVPKGFRCA
ncbi:lipid transfer protein EARLI 1-like [Aegilops tauschii subsp. strangulata]|uniref:Bifunctional inhibitor/plant lipid transfer protein/seed storage helical domain-containing protein n=1 Tax=Aegilops tauschii subsp. strangulata TaxID=200361 RepID=A0A453SLN0_AEGTS|nr:lipid transfer protein EARLI 1-like [Aegilops tauschii subsp. strangulata]